MGIYPQPNDWTCGPFALKHALLALGKLVTEDQINAVAQAHWWSGTDEIRLSKAADAFDCGLDLRRRIDAEKARKALASVVRDGTPAILCVDEWGHWITVVGHEKSRFVVLDSNMDPVLNVISWPELRRRWGFEDSDYDALDPPIIYDLFVVRPRFRVTIKANFSVARVKFLRRPENAGLGAHWNDYLEDLLEVCRPASTRRGPALSMAEFLRRNQELITGRVAYWHGDIEKTALVRLLQQFRFVAETYGLVVPEASARRAVVDMSVLTALWVAAARGIGEMYGDGLQ